MPLRPYQQDCLQRILRRYREGLRRVLVALPTGTGKTVIFAQLPTFLRMKKRMLVLAHRQELLEQAAEKFRTADPDVTIGIEQGARRAAPDARIVLASVPTLGRGSGDRLGRLDPEDFYLIVVDEAHHAVAASYRRIFDHFGLFEADTKRLLIGFTATPRRGDRQNLGDVFEEIAFARSLPEMVRDGYLCAVRGWRVQSEVDLGGVGVRHGDFIEADLARAVDTPERNRLVVDAYRRLAPGRRAIAFCADVAHVHALAAELEAAGYRAASVWGAMAASDREGTLRRFREGKLDVLTNCNVLTEGFDEPRVDCVLMARPTQSQLLYSQMVGRGTRLHPQKSDLVVIDIVDNTARHSLVGLNALFDLAPNLDLAGNNALEVGDELERVAQAFPWVDLDRLSSASQLPLVAERIDLFRFEPPHEISDFTDLAWCRTPDGGYRLPLVDGEWVGVREDNLGRWAVTLHVVHGGDADVVLPAPTNELRSAITGADIVVKRARPDVVRLLTLDASWRDAPVTEKQIELLKRRKIPYPSGITRGQASWMISHSTIRR